MVSWVAPIISAGGELTYTRWTDADLPVPDNMSWLNGDGSRSDFSGEPASFGALRGLQEDLMIIEFTRFNVYESLGGDTTNEEMRNAEKTARLNFQQHLDATISKIGGMVDGSTSITTAQKKAMLLLLQQPSLH
jgi:hypothetical protein